MNLSKSNSEITKWAISEGVITANDVLADLHDLTRGVHPGRTSVDEITYFKSVGTALEDLAGAVTVWKSR
jgi:ornithine cyclodeaminase